jgi:geranylgeranyl diphosphate synthase type II
MSDKTKQKTADAMPAAGTWAEADAMPAADASRWHDTELKLAGYAAMIEEALTGFIPECPYPESGVAEAMAYSLLGGGKRIRGALGLAFYGLFHDDVKPAMPFACAIEMIHAYSLIHDDLPCMDDDDLRRGKPSCHKAFGEATALLAGDALLTLAFDVMTDNAIADGASCQMVQPKDILMAINFIAKSCGATGMIGGQAIDLAQEGKETPPELLRRMVEKKTGAMLEAAAFTGCAIAGAKKEAIAAACSYAAELGMAFQVRDDILDATGDEAVFGKPVGSDRENEKSTYVSIFGLVRAREMVETHSRQAVEMAGKLPGEVGFLQGLAVYLANREK